MLYSCTDHWSTLPTNLPNIITANSEIQPLALKKTTWQKPKQTEARLQNQQVTSQWQHSIIPHSSAPPDWPAFWLFSWHLNLSDILQTCWRHKHCRCWMQTVCHFRLFSTEWDVPQFETNWKLLGCWSWQWLMTTNGPVFKLIYSCHSIYTAALPVLGKISDCSRKQGLSSIARLNKGTLGGLRAFSESWKQSTLWCQRGFKFGSGFCYMSTNPHQYSLSLSV